MAKGSREREPGLEIALEKAGGVRALARLVKRSSATVAVWTRVPIEHVPFLEHELDMPRHELRPDIYPPEIFNRPPPRRRRRA